MPDMHVTTTPQVTIVLHPDDMHVTGVTKSGGAAPDHVTDMQVTDLTGGAPASTGGGADMQVTDVAAAATSTAGDDDGLDGELADMHVTDVIPVGSARPDPASVAARVPLRAGLTALGPTDGWLTLSLANDRGRLILLMEQQTADLLVAALSEVQW